MAAPCIDPVSSRMALCLRSHDLGISIHDLEGPSFLDLGQLVLQVYMTG